MKPKKSLREEYRQEKLRCVSVCEKKNIIAQVLFAFFWHQQVTLKAIKESYCQSANNFVSKAIIEKMLFKDILDHQFDEGSKVFKVLDKSGMPSVTCRSVQHCQQQFNWDCGLSCVLMALDAADLLEVKDTILANIEEICRKEGFGHSTWSIDLCYLIKHYAPQLRFSYTTITIGVDPSYMNQVS